MHIASSYRFLPIFISRWCIMNIIIVILIKEKIMVSRMTRSAARKTVSTHCNSGISPLQRIIAILPRCNITSRKKTILEILCTK